MPTLLLDAIRFHYDDPYQPVFENQSLEIDSAWRSALIGRNGQGKSTLLGLLAGRLRPHSGRIHCPLPTTCFPAPVPDPSDATRGIVRESIAPYARLQAEMQTAVEAGDARSLERYGELALEFERCDGYRIDERIDAEWDRMGLAHDRLAAPFASLSGGEQTRAAIIALFLGPPRYPLIDEPTNHLDAAGRRQLGDYLASKSGFLLVSHDRAFLDRCVDHVIALEHGELRLMETDYSGLREQLRREQEHADRQRTRLQREIKDLEAGAREKRTWSDKREKAKNTGHADRGYEGRRAARLMKRALTSERRAQGKLDEKRALLHRPEKERILKLLPRPRGRSTLLVADRVAVRVGERRLVQDFSLRLERGDRLAVLGPNGCGKSLLLDVLAGARAPDAGQVALSAPLSIVRCHQQPLLTAGLLVDHLRAEGRDETAFRNVLGVLGMEGDLFDRPLETFSEGELKKVDLVPSFGAPADLWIWDEPMNFLDIDNRERIERAVLDAEPTLLFVEHDMAFVERIATRLVVFESDGSLIERPVGASL